MSSYQRAEPLSPVETAAETDCSLCDLCLADFVVCDCVALDPRQPLSVVALLSASALGGISTGYNK